MPESFAATRDKDSGTPEKRVSIAQLVLAAALVVALFYPYLVAVVAPPRLVVTTLGALLLATTLGGPKAAPRRLLLLSCYLLWVLSVLAAANAAAVAYSDPLVGTNIQRLLLVTPVMLSLGYRLFSNPAGSYAARAFVAVAAVTALLAGVEFLTGRSLFGRSEALSALIRSDSTRALLASDHALVLGAMIACAVPLTLLIKRASRLVVIPLLIVGSYCTGSRGPTMLAVMFAILVMVPALLRYLQTHSTVLMTAAALAIVTLSVLSAQVWSTTVVGATGEDYSTNYRWALYASLPALLSSVPFGYGLGALPQGVWLVQSEIFGVRDLTATLDSELVYSAFTFGWLGVGAVIVVFFLGVRGVRTSPAVGLACTSVTLSGFFLALHAWDSIGPLWLLLAGAAVAALRSGRIVQPTIGG